MMLKKALSKSGRRILKAIKKFSSSRLAKKLEIQQQQQQEQLQQQQQKQIAQPQQQQALWTLQTKLYELDNLSVASCSLPSLDAKSVDTFVTYVVDGYLTEECYLPYCCCHCDERDENQRNENIENEMLR